jgi:excisionase family DNA binding protein
MITEPDPVEERAADADITGPLAYTPEEIARMWRVPVRTVDQLIRGGHLAAVRVGRHRRITPAAAEAYLARTAWKAAAA